MLHPEDPLAAPLPIYTYINIYIYIHSSYDKRIQRKQSAQYRKRRAITVKVALTSYYFMLQKRNQIVKVYMET